MEIECFINDTQQSNQPMPSVTAAAVDDEEWTEMSRNDDAMVADMLLRLRHAVPPPRPSSALRLVWTVRQRRSGSTRKDDDDELMVKKNRKKKKEKGVESTRASPSTPLSFSAATSTSGGAAAGESPEESSSRPPRSKLPSLKVSSGNPTKKTIKRVKKKKTLVELKIEEDELLKEKTSLKNELAKLCLRVEEERVKNEIFKRKKLDLQQIGSPKSDEVDSEVQSDQMVKVEKCETVFELPDLNLPFEQQQHYASAAEAIY